MKDNFSAEASAYAKFRPHYPNEMIDFVVSCAPNRNVALDLATGNGQIAAHLASHFKTIYATDISQKQLDNATVVPNVIYKKESAEQTGFANQQFDLITVAQAVHWFEFDTFYKEIYRILQPDGIFAVLGYGLFSTNPHSDQILSRYYKEIVGPYWDAERTYIEAHYQIIPFPFDEVPCPKFTNTFQWRFEQLIGYLETWSATQHYKNKIGTHPIDLIYDDLKISWEKEDHQVRFPLLLRIGKLKNQQ